MKIIKKIIAYTLVQAFLYSFGVNAQIPMPKRADSSKTFLQKINDELPTGLSVSGAPSMSSSIPGLGKNRLDEKNATKTTNETLPDLGLKVSKKMKQLKKGLANSKPIFNGKDYEGLPVEKHLIRQGSGERLTFFEFYTLKNFQEPSPYIRHLFWYDEKTDRIVEALIRNKESYKILHGPYKKFLGESVIEEGFYAVGAKDGRWERYDKDFKLLNKEKYYRGFYEDSRISFYDDKQTKIKEVVPKLFGKVTGEYYAFNEGGTLAVQGMMDDSIKVGQWIEYFPIGNKRKKETQYGKDCYDKAFEPFVLREYDEKGRLIFDVKRAK